MKRLLPLLMMAVMCFILPSRLIAQNDEGLPSIQEKTRGMERFEGFFPFFWDADKGKIWLEVNRWETEFLYVHSLSAGVGSNDIGLDRGQLGRERIVRFVRTGPKVLMIQPNYDFRATTDNPMERRAVEEAFAQSVLAGFEVVAEENDRVLIDLTPLLMQDAHNVAGRLAGSKQGSYKLDPQRSSMYLPRTKNFPQNSEWEVLLTFAGQPAGSYVYQVVPSPEAITVRQHHSFIQLPDARYRPREYDPRSGYLTVSYQDYGTPIDEPLVKRFIARHRLEKKNPEAALSEPVAPIVYYLDPGTPEPVRSALLEGARWWNQAFEAAGYKDAFQVTLLPEDADPMDVRYNVIQWVHRATRGWSYGASVIDPRSGEIIKGHVSLGSLRVRQDFLIAQGLLSPYETGQPVSPLMKEMALARLRQLSAHEVGHTLGLRHNYAASTNDRASVMDYPHPWITLKDDGSLDFSEAYDTGIGAWDKVAIAFGYQDFPEGTDEASALHAIIDRSLEAGIRYLTDQDARPVGSAHPLAHLWDNGTQAAEELDRILALRQKALSNFGEKSLPAGMPMALLEEVLVPLYLAHRYQVEAAAKLVGGMYYTYALKGDGQAPVNMVSPEEQQKALTTLLATLDPATLEIPERILRLIPPHPPGYSRGRETFSPRTGSTFDPLAAAASAANHTLTYLFHPDRANRLVQLHARDAQQPGWDQVLQQIIDQTINRETSAGLQGEIQREVNLLTLRHLFRLTMNSASSGQVKAIAYYRLGKTRDWLEDQLESAAPDWQAHYAYLLREIEAFEDDPEEMIPETIPAIPDGSPIGMDCMH